MRHKVFMRFIKIIAEVFMPKLLTLIYKPKVFVLMALQYIRNLTFNNKKDVSSFVSLFVNNVFSRMILRLNKWRYPRHKVMMLLIFQIHSKKLYLIKFLIQHLLFQFDTLCIRHFFKKVIVILCCYTEIVHKIAFELFNQILVYIVLIFYFF